MRIHEAVIRQNLQLLAQGRELLERMEDSLYGAELPHLAARPVGCHFRHTLDFYDRLLSGAAMGRVDYDARTRKQRIEEERGAALEEIERLRQGLEALSQCDPEQPIEVNLDNALEGTGEVIWSRSTLLRELQGLVSHTVHHYALIGILLKAKGFEPGPEFGVAPSTLEYERRSTATSSRG